jgi:hypothetical protein
MSLRWSVYDSTKAVCSVPSPTVPSRFIVPSRFTMPLGGLAADRLPRSPAGRGLQH